MVRSDLFLAFLYLFAKKLGGGARGQRPLGTSKATWTVWTTWTVHFRSTVP